MREVIRKNKIAGILCIIAGILCIIAGALLLSACEYPAAPVATTETMTVPPYEGEPSTILNDNIPCFGEADKTTQSFETYSELDALGRCGTAFACIGTDLMPTEEREQISEVHPTGWNAVKYDGIDGDYLYNRCHLIAYSLTAENANEKNLITGTRYMNKDGMNPYEITVANYVRNTGHHVLYRVTPVFEGNNLVASGVEIEAQSVEDGALSFHVYCYNVQPGIEIDYRTGESTLIGSPAPSEEALSNAKEPSFPEGTTYILNTNTQKFHRIDCESVLEMSEGNRLPTRMSRDEIIAAGYAPCGSCKP